MIKRSLLILISALLLPFLTACDRIEGKIFGEPVYGYRDCLTDSFKGSHNYTAKETKAPCEEITGSEEPHYTYTDEGLVPSNDFTICYKSWTEISFSIDMCW